MIPEGSIEIITPAIRAKLSKKNWEIDEETVTGLL